MRIEIQSSVLVSGKDESANLLEFRLVSPRRVSAPPRGMFLVLQPFSLRYTVCAIFEESSCFVACFCPSCC